MAACVLLHMTGILEFRNSVTFTHILMAMDILYLGYALVHYVKKHGMDRIAKTNIVGIIILFAAFAADIIFFYVISTVVDILGRTGFLVYICLLAWLAASDSMEKLHEGQKAAIYKELALKDILTGLYSRNAYDEWERDNQHPDKTAIVMLDLNNLKKCNDRYGHEAGDTYLKKASEMITNAFSQENTVYRIGGDEFCVIMPDAKENSIEGKLVASGLKVGIVAARFNEFIVSKLVSGALDGLKRHDVKEEDIDIAWVPGAFEIPLIADKMAKSKKYDAVICLGTVIRGATSHYDYVCNEVSKGIAQVSLNTGIPVLFGVVTTENIEQAIERAGTKAGNKGYDCALSAIEMVQLIKEVEA